jgi:energy-coupling factor transport system permease protein
MEKLKKLESLSWRQPGQAYQFRSVDSPIHRLGAGWKLGMVSVMSIAAFAAQEPWSIAGLLLLNVTCYFLARLGLAELWRDMRFFLCQTLIVVGLFALRFGITDGLWPGVRTGLQILLFFMPSAVFLRTTQSSQMIQGLRRILPERLSFVVFTSLRFLPFFSRELREIAMAQRLRGAPLTARQLIDPRNWRDIFHCLMIPLVVRALKTAHEAALSAEARGFGQKLSAAPKVDRKQTTTAFHVNPRSQTK